MSEMLTCDQIESLVKSVLFLVENALHLDSSDFHFTQKQQNGKITFSVVCLPCSS